MLTDVENADTPAYAAPCVLDGNPIPGRQWSDFVSNTETGARDCVDGIKSSDEQQYLRAPAELKQGLDPLLKLQKGQS